MNKNINIKSIREIILNIIEYTKKQNLEKLHNLESNSIELAIIYNNKDISDLCVIIFALRKLMSKKHIGKNSKWNKIQEKIINHLELSSNLLMTDKKEYYNEINLIKRILEDTDKQFGHYITKIIENAKIKLASTAYAYGLSASQASSLFSITKDRLMSFVAMTKMPDEDIKVKSIKERVQYLEEN